MWARWLSETSKGGFLDFFICVTTTFFHFAHIFFISAVLKFERFQRCSYFEIGANSWVSWKWAFIKYFQMAGVAFEQRGHALGTFEHGEDGEDLAVTLYEYFTFIKQP
jgi:hypothetical protein